MSNPQKLGAILGLLLSLALFRNDLMFWRDKTPEVEKYYNAAENKYKEENYKNAIENYDASLEAVKNKNSFNYNNYYVLINYKSSRVT